MKKQYTFLVLGLCAGLLITACSDDDYTNDFTRPAGGNQIFFNCQSQLDENNKVIWAADSKIGFFCEQTETVNLAVGLAAPFVGQTEGLFYTQVIWNKEAGDHTFYVYAPYNKNNTSAKAIAGTLSNSQLQSGTANTHLMSSALTYATATSAEVETAVPMTFKHALGYMDVSCKTAAKYAGWKIKSIEFSTEDGVPLAGEYKFDLTTGQFAIAEGSSKVQVKVDNAPELVQNEAFHGYMSINPLNLSAKQCKVTVVIEKAGEDNDLSLEGNLSSVKILAGEFNTLEVDMDALTETVLGDNSVDLSANETANCYIAGKAGQEYRFNATVMGNGAVTPAGTNTTTFPGITPSILAPSSVAILWQSARSLVSGVKLKNNYVYFTLNGSDETPLVSGNAVIAAYDDTGAVIWSWHIWVTDADLDAKVQTYTVHQNYANFATYQSPVMMDRNLGATSAELWNSDTDSKDAHGLFYQWGRKDPLIGPSSENATSIAVVYDKDNNTIEPTDWATTTTPITRDDIAKYPMTIYGGASGISENWFAEDACDLWGSSVMYAVDGAEGKGAGEKSIYDPCPPGYRVPHPYVWSTFTSEPGGGKHKTAGFTTTIDDGIKTLQNTTGATFSSTYVYPATGFIAYTASFATGPALQRLSKGLANVGINNWSNAANAANRGARFFFDNGGCSTPAGNPRAYGYCVRCMKDTK